MHQALQMEMANFSAEHWHLREDDRHRHWKERIRHVDDEAPGLLAFSSANAMDILQTPADSGSRMDRMDRRSFVPTAPGLQMYSPAELQLSRSAPADMFASRLQHYQSGPEFLSTSTCGHTRDDLSLNVPYGAPHFFPGHPGSPHGLGPTGSPVSDSSHALEAGIDSGLTDPPLFGRTSCHPWISAYLTATDLQTDQTPLVPNQEDNFAGLPLNANSTSSPATGELTTSSALADTTFASSMSSQNITMGSTSFGGGADVLHFGSNTSNVSDFPRVDSCGDVSMSFPYTSSVAASDSTFFPMESDNSRFVSNPFHFPHEDSLSLSTFPYSDFNCSQLGPDLVVEDWSVPIARVDGFKTDNASPALQQGHDEAAVNPSRRIAPKAKDEVVGSPQPSISTKSEPIGSPQAFVLTGVGAVPAHDGKRKLAIPKAPYIRPKYPKRMCNQCNEHPEGFRGEHELRRHIERAHNNVKKMWVCVDASPDQSFLANCKRCRVGKKYGAYYNAAAHLRRAHFNKRLRGPRGRVRNPEKRGGSGGGLEPPMEILKHWMEEIEVVRDGNVSESTPRSESPLSDEDTQADDMTHTPEEDLSTESYDMGCTPIPYPMSPILAAPSHDASSYSSQQAYESYQTTQPATANGAWLSNEPSHHHWVQQNDTSFDFSAPDFNPRSSFNSCSFQASEMEQQMPNNSFDEEYFPVRNQ